MVSGSYLIPQTGYCFLLCLSQLDHHLSLVCVYSKKTVQFQHKPMPWQYLDLFPNHINLIYYISQLGSHETSLMAVQDHMHDTPWSQCPPNYYSLYCSLQYYCTRAQFLWQYSSEKRLSKDNSNSTLKPVNVHTKLGVIAYFCVLFIPVH